MSHLPIWSFFEQSGTQRNEFGAKVPKKWSSSTLVANGQRNFKNN